MMHSLRQQGENTIKKWLTKLGYMIVDNGRIVSERSRVFVMTIHSEYTVQMTVHDTLKNDIEFKSNELIIKEFGREIYNNGPLKIYCAFSE